MLAEPYEEKLQSSVYPSFVGQKVNRASQGRPALVGFSIDLRAFAYFVSTDWVGRVLYVWPPLAQSCCALGQSAWPLSPKAAVC